MEKAAASKRIVVILLALSMVAGMFQVSAIPARADDLTVNEPVNEEAGEQAETAIAPIIGGEYIDADSEEPVRVSIVLEEDSTLAAGFDPQTIATNSRAIAYRDSLEFEQEEMAAVIEDEVLDEGQTLDVVWNLTLAANIISANVPEDAIEAIAGLPGVKEVVVEVPCYPQVIDIGGELEPNMAISGEMNGTQTVWRSGYTGAGMQIAVIDTGLDLDHISFSSDAFDHAIDELEAKGQTVELLTESFLEEKLDSLNVYKRDNTLTAENLYKNSKVPFAYNYNDRDYEKVGHDDDQQGEHGSHVAGIAAANRYVDKDEDGQFEDALDSVLTAGNAPDAQIIVMKVFGQRSGAVASDYMAAIEDAIVLGADAINLSLGSRFAGFVKDSAYEKIMRDLETSGAVVSISSGNNGYWAENTNPGALYADGINFATDASPGTYKNAFTVASVDNLGIISPTVEVSGEKYTFTESSGPNKPISGLAGKTYDYIYIDGVGEDGDGNSLIENFKDQLDGKVVFLKRGESNFVKKHELVEKNNGVACIVVNNASGTVNMSLTDSTATIPCLSILEVDGEAIKKASTPVYDDDQTTVLYYTGTGFAVNADPSVNKDEAASVTVSDFSSWGVPGDLTLKPEISAPGGNIYSVYGSNIAEGYANPDHDKYELMSGTSMAAPQIAGLAALVKQYIETSGASVDGLNERALMHSLLMSTAQPIVDAETGSYYPVFQQGAGMANVERAVSTPVTVTVDGQSDGKVKAELGDDIKKSGSYQVTFTLHNMTKTDQGYYLTADVFSQDIFEEGEERYLDTATRPMGAEVTFTDENGRELTAADMSVYDFNRDGSTDRKDAQVLLASVLNGLPLAGGDLSGDGQVTSYDVHLLLKECAGQILVPAGKAVTVTATIRLNDAGWEEYPAGAYVEAYINADAIASDEGALAPSLHIPVLGFYGNWSDSSMYDFGTYGNVSEKAYLNTAIASENTSKTKGQENYLLLGRAHEPLTDGGEVDANSILTGCAFSLIRNAGNGVVQIKDADSGELLWQSKDLGSFSAAYWYNDRWFGQANTASFSWRVKDKDGNAIPADKMLTVSLVMAPEYYADKETGTYDWKTLTDGDEDNGELGTGAYLTTTLTTKELVEDLEAPKIVEKSFEKETTGTLFTKKDVYTITVKVSDDVDLASIRLYYEQEDRYHPGTIEEKLVYWYGIDCYDSSMDYNDEKPNFTPTKEFTAVFDREWVNRAGGVSSLYGDAKFVGLSKPYSPNLNTPRTYMIEVTDMAGNVTRDKIYVDTEPVTEATKVTIYDADGKSLADSTVAIRLLNGKTYQLSAEASPSDLEDTGVTWSSGQPEIAEVDENTGLVTAHKAGKATITAKANAKGIGDRDVTAKVDVEVFSVPVTATGVAVNAWDQTAKQFTWDFGTGTYSAGGAVGGENELYPAAVADIDGDTYYMVDTNSVIYKMNADGTVAEQGEKLSSLTVPWDMAYVDGVGLLWLYDSFLAVEQGDPLHVDPDATVGFNLTKATGGKLENLQFFGLAVDDQEHKRLFVSASVGSVDTLATVYLMGIDSTVTSSSSSGLFSSSKIKVAKIYLYNDKDGELDYIGSETSGAGSTYVESQNTDLDVSPLQDGEFFLWMETPNCNMVRGEDGALYLSVKNGKTGTVSYVYRLHEEGYTSYSKKWVSDQLGDFGEDVLPGLFLTVKNNADAGSSVELEEPAVEPSVGEGPSFDGASPYGLGLDRIVVSSDVDTDGLGLRVDVEDRTIVVPVSVQSTNGRFTLSYDAENVSLDKVTGSGCVTAYADDKNGTVSAGFAEAAEYTGTVMLFTFKYREVQDVTFALTTVEDGQNTQENRTEYTVHLTEEQPVNAVIRESTVELDGIPAEKQEAILGSLRNTAPDAKDLSAAASENVEVPEDAPAQAEEALKKGGVETENANIRVVAETRLNIAVENYEQTAGENLLSMDISAVYQLLATTAESDGDINTSGEGKKNAVALGEEQKLTVNTPISLTVGLPAGFTSESTILVKHTKNGGEHYHRAAIETTEDGVLLASFKSDDGLSPFLFSTSNKAEASIGDIFYTTLQDAIDHAGDGDTVTVYDSDAAAVVGRALTVTLVGGEGVDDVSHMLSADSGYQMAIDGAQFTFIPTASPRYRVTVSEASNGSVASNRKFVTSGTKVTVTVTPDAGYHISEVKVTRSGGKTVDITDSADGTYTFAMPDFDVTVTASFIKCPSLAFTDLDTTAWYHTYTDHVISEGLMRGVSADAFDPNGTVSRAQMVTVLWNLSGGKPVDYLMAYTDVPEGEWYTEAVRWASSEGIAGGYGDGRFGPDDPITREQMAAMLYRYEQKLRNGGFTGYWSYRLPFNDLGEISDWAVEAVSWCNMTKILQGKENDVFDPAGTALRSEMAAVVTRYQTM